MEEALARFVRALSDRTQPVSISDVEKLREAYPFFTLPAVTLMRREGTSLPEETRRRLMSAAALNAPDPATLAMLTDREADRWLGFYPPEPDKKTSTDSAIDTFLATYGHVSAEEDALLERMIFNPAPDYSVMLAREEEENLPEAPDDCDSSPDALINSFILKSRAGRLTLPDDDATTPAGPDGETADDEVAAMPAAPTAPERKSTAAAAEPEPAAPTDHPVAVEWHADDTSLSESLAKIYIRRRRYDKAFEIIHNLSLNNPKKSVYFADQLRFLRKLMLNSQYKNQI